MTTKNVTLSAEEAVLERARDKARRQRSSLNAEFRRWLDSYAGQDRAADDYERLMERLSYVEVGRRFTRD